MGDKYTVFAWLPQKYGGYADMPMYAGPSLIRAIRAMRRARRVSNCVQLVWR